MNGTKVSKICNICMLCIIFETLLTFDMKQWALTVKCAMPYVHDVRVALRVSWKATSLQIRLYEKFEYLFQSLWNIACSILESGTIALKTSDTTAVVTNLVHNWPLVHHMGRSIVTMHTLTQWHWEPRGKWIFRISYLCAQRSSG
jgi:hypothetical protein